MRHYLRISRKERPRGTALAVAMLVIVLLSGIGAIALNAASYDVASSGAIRQGGDASAIAQAGLVVGRCEMCEGLDGIIIFMQKRREGLGLSPEFSMSESMLEQGLADGQKLFAAPSKVGGRGSFGFVVDAVNGAPGYRVKVRIDRPRETGSIAGYSMRESVGADSASFCFRTYRMTSTGTFIPPPGANPALGIQTEHRSYITAGPVECTN